MKLINNFTEPSKFVVYGLCEGNWDKDKIQYIGATTNPLNRLKTHIRLARGNSLQDWIREIDFNLTMNILCQADSKEQMYSMERELLRLHTNLLNIKKCRY